MAAVFDVTPGAVAILPTNETNGLPVAFDSITGSWYSQFRAILSGVSLDLEVSKQDMHTLNNTVYRYVFGDRLSPMRIDGLAFQGQCGDTNSGFSAIMALYNQNKASVRSTPLQVQIGVTQDGLFLADLVSLKMEILRAEERIAQFSFVLDVLPATTTN